jgi:hypothetical protein
MDYKILMPLIAVIVLASSLACAQVIDPKDYPIHMVVENVKFEPGSGDQFDKHFLVTGTIGAIYKIWVNAGEPSVSLGDPVKFDVTCKLPAPVQQPVISDNPSPACDSILNAKALEIWAMRGANGMLAVGEAKAK